MKRQLFYSLALLLGAVLIAGLLYTLRPEPVEEERVEEVPLVEAVPFEAASGPIPVLASGTVQAREEVTVSAQVSGRLTYVHPAFREGGSVPKGAVLLRIDPTDFQNQVRIAQADVAAQNVAVLQAEEEMAIARAELERFDTREAKRTAGLSENGQTQILPPRQMAGQSQEGPKGTESDTTVRKAPKGSEQGSRTLASREPQLQSAKAARERAGASLADAKTALGRTRITAPFGGLVREENAALGALVQPGEPLGTIAASGAYEVRVSLTADEAALVPGLLNSSRARIPAKVLFEYGGKTYRWNAFVDRASAILDSATRNIEVFLRVPSPLRGGELVSEGEGAERTPPLLLGAFVDAEITGASLDTYAAVPADAVRPGNEIWLVRDGKLAIVPVRVIQRSDDVAYITTPSLAEGGRIVTSSLTAPIEGMSVRVAGAKAE